ncbi:MAG: anaerobic ribonucleoside-triphosphate reductase, partial [bacterium]
MMIKHIRKRDGRLVSFLPEKITEAVFKATRAIGEPDRKKAEKITRQVVAAISVIYKDERVPTVENVQDLVERMLIEDGYAEVAKAYILYREQHAKLRETKALLSDAVSMVDSYLGGKDWRVRENSNMSYSLQGLNNHIFSLVTSNYWLSKLYPQNIKDSHISGDIHIHDIGVLSVYCCGWDLKDLLTRGFGGASGKVESSPPKHFRSALGQIVNFFYTLQGEAAGAQAFSNFDTLLSPFIRYDGLSYKDVRQCLQEFVFNMNIPTRVGFQTPFSNITMDVTPPRNLAKEYVIIGGKPQDTTYSEFEKEMLMINKAFCEVMAEGDAKGRVFTFPIPTYNIT